MSFLKSSSVQSRWQEANGLSVWNVFSQQHTPTHRDGFERQYLPNVSLGKVSRAMAAHWHPSQCTSSSGLQVCECALRDDVIRNEQRISSLFELHRHHRVWWGQSQVRAGCTQRFHRPKSAALKASAINSATPTVKYKRKLLSQRCVTVARDVSLLHVNWFPNHSG